MSRPLSTLRRLIRQRASTASVEHCELCSAPLAAEHQHLIEPASRRLVCACDPCALLFDQPIGGRYRRVGRDVRLLTDFVITDDQWDSLLVPINMAFFFYNTPAGKIGAFYPSPAGATESLLSLDAWDNIARANPTLLSMAPDVEALLANRLGAMRGFAGHEYYLAPIDVCFELVGLIRTHWRGLSGGSEVYQHLTRFFADLKHRAVGVESPAPSAGQHG
ncbi:MAG TPA: DUF5947 family protein [Pirellulales bacterium]|nr:DUF5947 family protein [Pirellulales bacterium]